MPQRSSPCRAKALLPDCHTITGNCRVHPCLLSKEIGWWSDTACQKVFKHLGDSDVSWPLSMDPEVIRRQNVLWRSTRRSVFLYMNLDRKLPNWLVRAWPSGFSCPWRSWLHWTSLFCFAAGGWCLWEILAVLDALAYPGHREHCAQDLWGGIKDMGVSSSSLGYHQNDGLFHGKSHSKLTQPTTPIAKFHI